MKHLIDFLCSLKAIFLPNVYAVETEDITNGEVYPTYAYDEIGRRAAEIVLNLGEWIWQILKSIPLLKSLQKENLFFYKPSLNAGRLSSSSM